MRIDQAMELKQMGEQIEVKVTVVHVAGETVVNIRDSQLSSFVRASLLLQHIQKTEDPNYHEGLIG